MQPSMEDVTAPAAEGLDAVPARVDLSLPAVPEMGRAVAALIGTIVHAWEIEARVGPIGEAGRAVTDELALRTAPWSGLRLSVELDDVDVYVRLTAVVGDDEQPELTRDTETILARATSSYHVALEGTELLVVLQAPLR